MISRSSGSGIIPLAGKVIWTQPLGSKPVEEPLRAPSISPQSSQPTILQSVVLLPGEKSLPSFSIPSKYLYDFFVENIPRTGKAKEFHELLSRKRAETNFHIYATSQDDDDAHACLVYSVIQSLMEGKKIAVVYPSAINNIPLSMNKAREDFQKVLRGLGINIWVEEINNGKGQEFSPEGTTDEKRTMPQILFLQAESDYLENNLRSYGLEEEGRQILYMTADFPRSIVEIHNLEMFLAQYKNNVSYLSLDHHKKNDNVPKFEAFYGEGEALTEALNGFYNPHDESPVCAATLADMLPWVENYAIDKSKQLTLNQYWLKSLSYAIGTDCRWGINWREIKFEGNTLLVNDSSKALNNLLHLLRQNSHLIRSLKARSLDLENRLKNNPTLKKFVEDEYKFFEKKFPSESSQSSNLSDRDLVLLILRLGIQRSAMNDVVAIDHLESQYRELFLSNDQSPQVHTEDDSHPKSFMDSIEFFLDKKFNSEIERISQQKSDETTKNDSQLVFIHIDRESNLIGSVIAQAWDKNEISALDIQRIIGQIEKRLIQNWIEEINEKNLNVKNIAICISPEDGYSLLVINKVPNGISSLKIVEYLENLYNNGNHTFTGGGYEIKSIARSNRKPQEIRENIEAAVIDLSKLQPTLELATVS